MQNLGNPESRLVWQWKGHWYSLPISAQDVLTLARAVDVEGYPQEGVAWALIQRAAWIRSQGKTVRLGKLVEQYAQPINPAWFLNGPKHLAEVARLENLGDMAGVAAERAKAERRPEKANKAWGQLAPETRNVVTDIMLGKSRSPVIGAVHYWASRGNDFTSNQLRKPELVLLDRGYGFGPGRNVFFAEKGASNFGGVLIQHGGGAIPNGGGMLQAGMGPGTIVAGLLISYLAWKWLS